MTPHENQKMRRQSISFDANRLNHPNRRTVLRGLGAGVVGLTSLPGLVGSARAATDDNGKLVIVYDDSHAEDYEVAFPIHQEFDVPGCVAACPGLMEQSPQFLYRDELMEMHQAGWEVMSHTIIHRALGEAYIESDINPGDTEIHIQSNVHGRVEGDPLIVFDDQNRTEVTAAGATSDGGNEFILIEDPIDTGFEARDGHHTWVRYTDEFTEYVLKESKAMLEAWGFPVAAYVHTFNRFDGYVSEVVPQYYEAVPNAGRANPLTSLDNIDPYRIGRRSLEEHRSTIDEIAAFLDRVVDEPVFGVLYGHTNAPTLPPERIEQTIEMALERNIEIITLHDLLVEYDVIEPVPAPDPQPEQRGDDDTGDDDAPGVVDEDEDEDEDEAGEETDEPEDGDESTLDRSEEGAVHPFVRKYDTPVGEIPGYGAGAAGIAAVGAAAAYGFKKRRDEGK